MKQKKWFLMLVVCCLSIFLLTGCNSSEKGLYNLTKEVNNLKLVASSGEIKIDLNELPDEVKNDEEIAPLISQIQSQSIYYTGKTDMNNELLEYNFYLKNRVNGEQKELFSLVGKDGVLYIKIQGMIEFLKSFNDQELTAELDKFFGDTEYLSISNSELVKLMGLSAQDSLSPGFGIPLGQDYNIFQTGVKQNLIFQRLMDGLINEVYNDCQAGMITKTGNKFTLTLNADDFGQAIKPILTYSIINIDKVGDYLIRFLDNMSNEEMDVMGLDPDTKEQLITSIGTAINTVAPNKDEILAGLDEGINEVQQTISENMSGSKIVYSLEKKNATTYNSLVKVNIVANIPDEQINIGIEANNQDQVCGKFTVSAPASKVMTFTELEKRLTKTMTVEIKNGSYVMVDGSQTKKGTMEVKVIDGYSFLPMRQFATIFGENVVWDQETRSAYVEQFGDTIDMTNKIIDGQTFVKLQDFEKLGYDIKWNGKSKLITIIKKPF